MERFGAIITDIPVQALAILVGIDKFMNECRALTNLVGNGVTTIVISRLEGEPNADTLHATMAHALEVGEALAAYGAKMDGCKFSMLNDKRHSGVRSTKCRL